MKKIIIKILTIKTGVSIATITVPLITFAAVNATNKENNDILNCNIYSYIGNYLYI